MNNTRKLISRIRESIINDNLRQSFIFTFMDLCIGVICLFMSIVNVFTSEGMTLAATFTGTILCFALYFIYRKGAPLKLVTHLLIFFSIIVQSYFIISGNPEGFSAHWVLLIPLFSTLLTGLKSGICYSIISGTILCFFFWTPYGRSFLQYDYNETFLLGFPMFYLALTAVSLSVEYIRGETQKIYQSERDRYNYLYRHDALTGLYNRYGMNEAIATFRLSKKDQKTAIAMIDIDHFKSINDTYGHDAGDEVLKHIAGILKEAANDDVTIARWGGEEFLVIVRADFQKPDETADQIRKNVENSEISYHSSKIRCTISIGVCVTEHSSRNEISRLIKTADDALYNSKSNGRNRVTVISV